MYAAKQVEKFLADNKSVVDPELSKVIQRRADTASSNSDGLFLHKQVAEIFENQSLEESFCELAAYDYNYKIIASRMMESRNR